MIAMQRTFSFPIRQKKLPKHGIFSIFRLKMDICRLKMGVCNLKMDICKLKMEFP